MTMEMETVAAGPTGRETRYQIMRRATLIGVVINVLLSVGKVIAGVVGHSAAMVADGVHSASDLVSDGVVLLSARIAKKGADASHPYGHGKYETLATLFIAVALLAVALGIVADAIVGLSAPEPVAPTAIALMAAAVSIVSKEGLFRYTLRVGKAINAKAMMANAWHHRSDAVSSIAALLGIGAAMLGWPMADSLAAIAVGFFLAKVGIEFLQDALKELTDSADAIDREVRERIAHLVKAHPDVRSAHFLKARRMGPDIVVDVHVVVHPFLSVSEGHQIADQVQIDLTNAVRSITEVLVHVDTEDDQRGDPTPLYPARSELIRRVDEAIAKEPAFDALRNLTPHFLPDGIALTIVLAAADGVDLDTLRSASQRIAHALQENNPDFLEVQVSVAT